MAAAKNIIVKPITAAAATKVVKAVHYSGKIVQNSQLHFGVFLDGKLEGAMQFGPSLDKRKTQGLVSGTPWNGFIELNRMAFSDRLPRNSESRALGVAIRLIRKHYPHIEWIISFADGTQCGDGTIYRASGFFLTGIRQNSTLYEFPSGARIAGMTIEANWDLPIMRQQSEFCGVDHKYRTRTQWEMLGAKPLPGYQLRYVYFINPDALKRLTVPVLPYSKIQEMGAGMYRGQARAKQAMASSPEAQRQGGTDPHAPSNEAA